MLEPFGEKIDDLRAGIISSVIANVNRDPEKKPEPFSPSDFMINYEDALKDVDSYPIIIEHIEQEISTDDGREPKWMEIKRKVIMWNTVLKGQT